MERAALTRFAGVLAAGAVLGCGGRDILSAPRNATLGPGVTYAANATVRRIPVEGGCWVLDMPLGRYQPLSMPSAFQVDGLAVYAVVSAAPNAVSFCMVGPMVTLDSLRLR